MRLAESHRTTETTDSPNRSEREHLCCPRRTPPVSWRETYAAALPTSTAGNYFTTADREEVRPEMTDRPSASPPGQVSSAGVRMKQQLRGVDGEKVNGWDTELSVK